MQGNILSIGDKIELSHYSNRLTNTGKRKHYVSQLLDYIQDNKAKISIPIQNNKLVPLEIGEKYELTFYTKSGLYKCICIVNDRFKSDRLYIAIVEFTTDLEKYQRRQYFRLETVLNVKYRVLSEKEVKQMESSKECEINDDMKKNIKDLSDEQPITWINGTITDISGGGVRFNSETVHTSGDFLLLNFSLFTNSGFKVFHIMAHLVSTAQLPNRSLLHEHRVEFLNMNKEERECIVHYVFDEQRKQRRKESGRK